MGDLIQPITIPIGVGSRDSYDKIAVTVSFWVVWEVQRL